MAFSIKRSTYRFAGGYLRTETPFRDVPVLRMAYFPKTAHCAVFGKKYMLFRLAAPCGYRGAGEPHFVEKRKRQHEIEG